MVCHRGEGRAGYYGAETSPCDSPFSLVEETFKWIEENLKDRIDFVIWTGDSARHDSDEDIPRSPAQVLGTNRWIADKFFDVFRDPITNLTTSIPIVPTFGNNDILPHNILLPGPNKWLRYYSDIWRHFIPEEQRHQFEFGGWFYVEVIPGRLAVFSLNTLYFFDRNAGVDDCVQPSEPGYRQMEWLRIQLQFLRERGMKAILIGHVPPARTESKHNWDETCWQKYTLWLRQFRDVVVAGIYGHMNVDHFLLQDTHELTIGPYVVADDDESERPVSQPFPEHKLSIVSTADYLHELRDRWAKLPNPETFAAWSDNEIRGKKPKKPKKPKKESLGERFQVSFISPSIVPNYFPSIRVFEYNITGLEDATVWTSTNEASTDAIDFDVGSGEFEDYMEMALRRKKGHGKKGHKKPKKPKDPNLIVPEPPPKASPPGPAYSPQPLTLTGYTQYFANLTRIDETTNDKPDGGGDTLPPPRNFTFQEEYSTFTDRIYDISDLTVRSYVHLAYRIGQSSRGKGNSKESELWQPGSALPNDHDNDDDCENNEVELLVKGGKDKKKKRRKKKKKKNNLWIHFLKYAFVSTVSEKKLEKL